MPDCPVCLNNNTRFLLAADGCDYHRCATCQAVFMPPECYPDPTAERARYCQHRNDVDDPGYRRFLARLATPLLERLPPRQCGLDYGCGPGPALAGILRAAGHEVALYDPFFQPDQAVLAHYYDFITCTETAEHFHRPAEEFARLDTLLKPGGRLGIMTEFPPDDAQFADWYYRRDFTHVVFYRPATFQWLAAQHHWDCEIPANGVVIMRKHGGTISRELGPPMAATWRLIRPGLPRKAECLDRINRIYADFEPPRRQERQGRFYPAG